MTLFSYCEHCGARSDQAHYSNCTANDLPISTDNGWCPIETLPKDKMASHNHFLLCHAERKWIRFGRYYPDQREWYYSATNERTQYAQIAGDAPTHWQPMPALPTPPSVASRVPSTKQEP